MVNDAPSLAEIAFALELEALVAGKNRSKLEVVGHRIGLSGDAIGKVLDDWERRARLMREASTVIRSLIEAETIAELWTDLTHPSRWKAGALGVATKFTRENLPFMNMVYTKLAFDHAVYYRLMEYLSPGYLERYERTMKEKAGQEYWLRPTATSR